MRGEIAILSLSLSLAAACGGDDSDPKLPNPAPELGAGGDASTIELTPIATEADGLNAPRDLAFNPLRPNELWVVNQADDSVVIVTDAPMATRSLEKRIDGYALHFMEEVVSIDFGQSETTFGLDGTFATCGETRNTYNDQAPPNDFMGPALWSSDLTVFAMQDPNGLGSHLDMLHNTPLCMGIVHDTGNVYWTVGGLHGGLDKYDFGVDDGIGNDNHLDGDTWRYAQGSIAYTEGSPNQMALDHATGILYIADGGNRRVARFDTASGTAGQMMGGLETPVQLMDGAVVEDFFKDPEVLAAPTGLELHEGILFVSDRESGYLLAFTLEGELANFVHTGLPGGALSGIAMGPDGKLYIVDTTGNRVLRVDPKTEASE